VRARCSSGGRNDPSKEKKPKKKSNKKAKTTEVVEVEVDNAKDVAQLLLDLALVVASIDFSAAPSCPLELISHLAKFFALS
jgi:hypothetical protein